MGYRFHIACSYQEALDLLGGRNERTLHSLAATRLEFDSLLSTKIERDFGQQFGSVRVFYHGTPVVSHCSDGWIHVSFGGYDTTTTRSRINACLPYGWRVRRCLGKHFLSAPDATTQEVGDFFSITPTMLRIGSLDETKALATDGIWQEA